MKNPIMLIRSYLIGQKTSGAELGRGRGRGPITRSQGLLSTSEVTWQVARGRGAKEAKFSLFPLFWRPLSTPVIFKFSITNQIHDSNW